MLVSRKQGSGVSTLLFVALGYFCILRSDRCPAVDCNDNGVPDERDVAPLFAVAECSDAGGETSFLAAADLDATRS